MHTDNFEVLCSSSPTNDDWIHTQSCLYANFHGDSVTSLYNVTCIGRGCDDANFYLPDLSDTFYLNCYGYGCDLIHLIAADGFSSLNESNFVFDSDACFYEGIHFSCDDQYKSDANYSCNGCDSCHIELLFEEYNCSCAFNEFTCDNGGCVGAGSECDFWNDCGDWSGLHQLQNI